MDLGVQRGSERVLCCLADRLRKQLEEDSIDRTLRFLTCVVLERIFLVGKRLLSYGFPPRKGGSEAAPVFVPFFAPGEVTPPIFAKKLLAPISRRQGHSSKGNFVRFSRSRTAALDLYHDDASLTSHAQGTHGGCFSNGLARDGALCAISGTTLRSMDAWVVER